MRLINIKMRTEEVPVIFKVRVRAFKLRIELFSGFSSPENIHTYGSGRNRTNNAACLSRCRLRAGKTGSGDKDSDFYLEVAVVKVSGTFSPLRPERD